MDIGSTSRAGSTTPFRQDLLLAAGLAAGPLVGIGLARFAYGLLLPAMRADLGWSYAQAGAMNTANAAGYLLGALAATLVLRRCGASRAFLGGLAVTALSVLACAATAQFVVLLGLRLLAGAGGAVTFIAATGLAAAAGEHRAPGRAAVLVGVCVGGAGVGIAVSGLAVPPLIAALAAGVGWRAGWLVLGAVALLALLPAGAASLRTEPARPAAGAVRGSWPRRQLAATIVSYTLFGLGYIAYMTFIVALLAAAGLGPVQITVFWTVLGTAAAVACIAWGPFLAGARGGRGLAVLLLLAAAAAALPLVTSGAPAAYVSGLLFGATVLPVVGAVTAIARRNLPAPAWGPAIGGLTVAFALGQCAGPLLAGALSDRAGGVEAGLVLSVALLGVGAVVALAQRDRPAPHMSGAGNPHPA